MYSETVLETAAGWVARHDELNEQEVNQLEKWLNENEQHRALFDDLMGMYLSDELTTVAYEQRYERSGTEITSENSNVTRFFSNRKFKAALSLVAAALVVAILLPRQSSLPELNNPTLITQQLSVDASDVNIGEISGADGSNIYLAPNTSASMEVGDKYRSAKLSSGQAFFDIASNPSKPFTVFAGDIVINVLGTEFDVNVTDSGVEVFVVEGSVAVFDVRSGISDVMTSGDALAVTSNSFGRIDREYLSWNDGWISADNSSLRAVVETLNTFSAKEIVLDNESLNSERVSGRFDLTNAQESLYNIAELLGLTVYASADQLRVSQPAEPYSS